jgi:SDR family mycofactocin-dependent oxidoreductase
VAPGSAGGHGESLGAVGGNVGAVGRSAEAAGRVAVVTGAARGIGAATVLALAADGWSILAVDSAAGDPALPYPMASPADLSGVVRRANEGAGVLGRVQSFVADVRDPGAVTAAVAEAEHRWGGLDAAIAVAGVIAGGVPLWEVPLAQQQAVLDVNLGGVLSLARAAVPALLRRPAPRSGRFLAVASAAATRGLPMLAAYCAAKAGVAGLIRALAAELADSGVTANAVSPGSTATPILDESARLYELPGAQAFASQQPVRRLLDPAEVAAVLAFLASPASSGMTGAIVPVDGGLAL